jgi:hypothetical protein
MIPPSGGWIDMNIYKISQYESNGFDTYDSAIVAANNPEIARSIHPKTGERITNWEKPLIAGLRSRALGWCSGPEYVEVELIGKAIKGTTEGVILSSFNAG